jgi:hypothetical protein
MRCRGTCLALLATVSGLAPAFPAAAWGGHGHRVAALVAQARLTPEARAQVDALLAGEPDPTLAGVADWADDERRAETPLGKRSEHWHFVNLPRGDCTYVPARDCPRGDCLVAAIHREALALADAARPRAERARALKFLVHFVADAHQPLHAGHRDDLGGNTWQLQWDGEGTNLHKVWDRVLPAWRGLGVREQADALLALPMPPDPTRRSDRRVIDWVEESCMLVDAPGFYPPQGRLQASYLAAQAPVADRRLRQAGERLADMINAALAKQVP